MNLLRKVFVPLAGVTIIALVISMVGPRTVRAVVATLVKDVDNPARQPFAEACTTGTFSSFGEGSCQFGAVTSGKRFVIETVWGPMQLTSGLKPISIDLQVCAAGYGGTDN